MAMGLPVIATRWGGPADYLDESCGVLLEPSSREAFVAALAAALVRLARSPAERRALGRAGLARVRERFDWEVKADAMLAVYRDAIAG
jgi:glycosyltransferase involved in cell wall biosynthesis